MEFRGRAGWDEGTGAIGLRKAASARAVGTTVKRYGVPGYAAFEVSLPDGRMELFWDHQLEEAPLPAKRRWSTGRRPVTHEPAL